MNGSFKMSRQRLVWKPATLTEKGKNKLSQWSELHVVCLHVWAFTDLWAVLNGPALWLGRRTKENRPVKEIPIWGTALWESSWEFALK